MPVRTGLGPSSGALPSVWRAKCIFRILGNPALPRRHSAWAWSGAHLAALQVSWWWLRRVRANSLSSGAVLLSLFLFPKPEQERRPWLPLLCPGALFRKALALCPPPAPLAARRGSLVKGGCPSEVSLETARPGGCRGAVIEFK